ncbi:hypothetical protein [Kutzneria albida]|nr:hypothetical protein [Kutzneria albida]
MPADPAGSAGTAPTTTRTTMTATDERPSQNTEHTGVTAVLFSHCGQDESNSPRPTEQPQPVRALFHAP